MSITYFHTSNHTFPASPRSAPFRREKLRCVLLLALALLCLGSGFLLIKYSIQTARSARIAEEVLRLHVIANSDSREDQALKLQVKAAIVDYLSEAQLSSREEMVQFADAHRFDLRQVAQSVVAQEGFSYPVSVSLAETYFPTKSYGDLTFPCGTYLALRVILGEGSGQNWWCVLYPPLCFVDITTGIVPDESKEELSQVLTEDDYLALTGEPVHFRSWFWDALCSLWK